MRGQNVLHDERYDALVSSLRSAGPVVESRQEDLLEEESLLLEGSRFQRLGETPPRRGMQVLELGELNLIAGRTTPVVCSNHSSRFSCFFSMPYIGGFTTTVGPCRYEVVPGDL